MALHRALKTLFLRGVYRNASPADEAGRNAYLDALDDVVMTQIAGGGRRMTSASSTNSSYSYEYLDGFNLVDLSNLSTWARSLISSATIEDAIAEIPAPVRFVSTSFARVIP